MINFYLFFQICNIVQLLNAIWKISAIFISQTQEKFIMIITLLHNIYLKVLKNFIPYF